MLEPEYALQDEVGRPLAHDSGQLALRAVNGVRKVRTQAVAGCVVDPAAITAAIGTAIPQGPLDAVAECPAVYWLAPNDWLVVNPEGDDDWTGTLLGVLSRSNWVGTEVSDSFAMIELSGTGTVATLAEACAVDLDAGSLPAGRFVLTRLQALPVVLHRLEAHRFRILVDRSSALFLWDWLRQSGAGAQGDGGHDMP